MEKEGTKVSSFYFRGFYWRDFFNLPPYSFSMRGNFGRLLLLIFFWTVVSISYGQKASQRITGTVVDKESRQPLPGANVFIKLADQDSTIKGAVTDVDGRFALEGVPVGRHYLNCSFIGYNNWTSAYLELTSAKQLVVNIELTEAITTGEEVVITAKRMGSEVNNEFSSVSGRSFTPEETQRFAGSINDPGRMALSLPGTQISTQDNENTIVVRANSPIGLSWRLEGIEIPNPNHFAEAGGSGGGISALSIYVLGSSDFLTGAFPAEYGNALAGVMDLKFKKGNRENREFRFQAGLIGLDFASEGPLSMKKKKASYVFNYRYSTLGILNQLGIHVVNPLTNDTFNDLSFNLYFPLNKKSHLTFFGFAGASAENKTAIMDPDQWKNYGESYTYDFYTKLGVTGLTYTHLIDENSYVYGVVSVGANKITENDDSLSLDLIKTRVRNEHYLNGKVTTSWSYNRKLGKANNLKAGFQLSDLFYDVFREDYDNGIKKLRLQLDGNGTAVLAQPYVMMKSQLGSSVTLQTGLNSLYFSQTKNFVLEPRLGLQIALPAASSINMAYGLHSQVLPFQTYEAVITDSLTGAYIGKPNQNLSLWRSHHFAVNFNKQFEGNVRIKVEPYYQSLFDIPVSVHPWSTYSLINQDRNFSGDSLINKGTGHNVGVELTLEKSFSNRLFFLLSGSVYDSKYKTNNGGADRFYNTKYNSNFNSALTFGKEWELTNSRRLEIGGRILWSGGMRYTPYDEQRSIETGKPVYIYSETYAQQVKNYFRVDSRVALRKNAARFAWKLSLDIQNLTNYKNPQRPYFDRWTGTVAYGFNTSIIPVISYTIDF